MNIAAALEFDTLSGRIPVVMPEPLVKIVGDINVNAILGHVQKEVKEVIMMVQSYEILRYVSEFALTNTEIVSVMVYNELASRSVFVRTFVQIYA